MSMRKYDLNLLTILDALLRHRNVTRAGQELGITQSTTSHALMRLREQFDDKLLTPLGRSLALTPRAEALAGPVSDLLQRAMLILDLKTFDPRKSARRFKIDMVDYAASLLLTDLLDRVKTTGPNVTIHVTWSGMDIVSKLMVGELDLAIWPEFYQVPVQLHSKLLFEDQYVVIASKEHPNLGDTIDLETFLQLRYATFRHDGAAAYVDLQLAQRQVFPRESLLVPSFLLLPFVVSRSEHIALIQRRLAEQMRPLLPIKLISPPFEFAPLRVRAFWSHRANSDPGHQWFREELIDLCERGTS
jgi:LysR family nod box-dependent transcriptional activator